MLAASRAYWIGLLASCMPSPTCQGIRHVIMPVRPSCLPCARRCWSQRPDDRPSFEEVAQELYRLLEAFKESSSPAALQPTASELSPDGSDGDGKAEVAAEAPLGGAASRVPEEQRPPSSLVAVAAAAAAAAAVPEPAAMAAPASTKEQLGREEVVGPEGTAPGMMRQTSQDQRIARLEPPPPELAAMQHAPPGCSAAAAPAQARQGRVPFPASLASLDRPWPASPPIECTHPDPPVPACTGPLGTPAVDGASSGSPKPSSPKPSSPQPSSPQPSSPQPSSPQTPGKRVHEGGSSLSLLQSLWCCGSNVLPAADRLLDGGSSFVVDFRWGGLPAALVVLAAPAVPPAPSFDRALARVARPAPRNAAVLF